MKVLSGFAALLLSAGLVAVSSVSSADETMARLSDKGIMKLVDQIDNQQEKFARHWIRNSGAA